MRLLFLNYEFPPMGGGAGFATLALARELVQRGHEVEILTARDTDSPLVESIDGVLVHRVRARRRGVHEAGMGGVLAYLLDAARVLPTLVRRGGFDICHYYFGVPTGLLSLLPGPHRRIPYVVSLRGSDVPGYDPRLDRMHRLMAPLTRRIWRRAGAVVANSAGLRDIALRAGTWVPEIQVIRNGVHDVALDAQVAPRAGLRVLTSCRLIERKRVETILRAIAQLDDPGVTLDIAGDGPQLAMLRSLAADLGIAGQVTFHGFVAQPQLAMLRAAADVFVLASSSESCSMAVLEAIGAGLPVLATRVGGMPELVREDQNGRLFPVGDVAALAALLGELVLERGRLARYSAHSRRLAREEFSWQAVAERYEALFVDVAARHGSPAEQPA